MPPEFDITEMPGIQDKLQQIRAAKTEAERLALFRQAFSLIKNNTGSIVGAIEDGIKINNFDEVQAALHNEFMKNTKTLMSGVKDLKLTTEEQTRILAALKSDNSRDDSGQFETIQIKRSRDKVTVTNPQDFPVSDVVSIRNLQELEQYFADLADVVRDTFNIEIPTPQVNVQAPEVNIPETVFPDMNFSEISEKLSTINKNLKSLKQKKPTNPWPVRLSDGEKWIDAIKAEVGRIQTALAGFSDRVKLVNKNGQVIDFAGVALPQSLGDGSKDVASAGTRVTLGTATCKYVIVVAKAANTGYIWLGGDTVAADRGRPLLALQAERVEVANLDQVYIDSDVNGEGVTFVYGI